MVHLGACRFSKGPAWVFAKGCCFAGGRCALDPQGPHRLDEIRPIHRGVLPNKRLKLTGAHK